MADPTIFEYAIEDDQGLTNRAALYMGYDGATETVDSLIGGWLAYGGLIDPCIDGQIINGRITIPLEPDGSWKAAPVSPGNNVNQVMVLNFENDFNRYLTDLLLPSYKESTLTLKKPNIGANPLLALINAVIAGSGAIFPNSRDLHDLDAIQSAFLTVRKVRNQKRGTRVVG
jgi:hypothetical protein